MKRLAPWLLLIVAGALAWIWYASRRTDPAAIADKRRELADQAGQAQENLLNSARPVIASAESLVRALPGLIWGDSRVTGGQAPIGDKTSGDSAGWTAGLIYN